jgi:hypothetical protein
MITRVYTHFSNESYSLQRHIEEYKDYYTRKKTKGLNLFYIKRLEIHFSCIFDACSKKPKNNLNL